MLIPLGDVAYDIYGLMAQATVVAPGADADSIVRFNAAPIIDSIFAIGQVMAGALSLLIMGVMPGWASTIFYGWKLNKIVENAVLASMMKVRDLVKKQLPADGVITFDVKNAVADDAIETVLKTTSTWVIFLGGGKVQLETMIKAWVEKVVTSNSTVYVESKAATKIPAPAKVIIQPAGSKR